MRVEYNDECERSIIKVTSVNTTRHGISEIIFSSLEEKKKKQNKTSTPIPSDAPESSTHTVSKLSHSTQVHAANLSLWLKFGVNAPPFKGARVVCHELGEQEPP